MKRTALKRVGKVGRANKEANLRLRELLGHVVRCEMYLPGCLRTWPLQFAHRHKRAYYKGDVEKLSNIKQVVVACQSCHDLTEHNRELNNEIFNKLRGNED